MKLPDYTSTCASPGPSLTSERLTEILESLKKIKIKRIIILFSPFATDRIMYGPFVDKMMNLRSDEQGFVVSERYRPLLAEYQGAYEEWTPLRLLGMKELI